jgi:hypothetical protein
VNDDFVQKVWGAGTLCPLGVDKLVNICNMTNVMKVTSGNDVQEQKAL